MASRGLRKTYFFLQSGAYINRFLTGILEIHKNKQKSKFLLSQTFKWKKIMLFVILEMPSKTFVML